MYRFLVVIEKTESNFSAYSPDFPGCVATGKTREETEMNICEAIRFHMQGLREDNLEMHESSSYSELMTIAVKWEKR
jgi:predicted RNase H-like HicB family nuclease